MAFKLEFCPCKDCDQGGKGKPLPVQSDERTPYALLCPRHGAIYLTHHGYNLQMQKYELRWYCPQCGELAGWDDDNWDEYLEFLQRSDREEEMKGEASV